MRKVVAERKGARVEVTRTHEYDDSQLSDRIEGLKREIQGYDIQTLFLQGKRADAQDELDQLVLLAGK